jgi:hypothetical protein
VLNKVEPDTNLISVLNLKDRPLKINISGTLRPWRQAQLKVPFPSKIISSLAENSHAVRKNDLLVSIWHYTQQYEYTPLNLLAPFDGIITQYNHTVGDEIPANQVILTIKNYDNYYLSVNLNEYQFKNIKTWNKAIIKTDNLELQGLVINMIPVSYEITILVPGKSLNKIETKSATGIIETGFASGTFILNKYFINKDSLKAFIEKDIEVTLKMAGISDSLALIYPELPGRNQVAIITDHSK